MINTLKMTLAVLTGLVLANVAPATDLPHIGSPIQDCFAAWGAPASTKMNKCGDGSGSIIYDFKLDNGTETEVSVSFGQISIAWMTYRDANKDDIAPILRVNCPSRACWTIQPNVPITNPKVPAEARREWDRHTAWTLNSATQIFSATYYPDSKTLTIIDMSWTIPYRHAAQTQVDSTN